MLRSKTIVHREHRCLGDLSQQAAEAMAGIQGPDHTAAHVRPDQQRRRRILSRRSIEAGRDITNSTWNAQRRAGYAPLKTDGDSGQTRGLAAPNVLR